MDSKHKHASHVIVLEGHAFKADDHGQWDLTDIWRTLGLPKGKQPGKWVETKRAKALEQTGNIGSLNKGRAGSVTYATKRAALAYAGWVSDTFEGMVYDAFEAILEIPEVTRLVAEKMRQLGYNHSASIIERMTENQERNQILRALNRGRRRSSNAEQKAIQKYQRQANYAVQKAHKQGQEWR